MANLHKYTSTEALNISYSSDFRIQDAWSISNTEVTKDVSGYHTVFLQTDEDIYYGFSDSTNAILGTAANNIYLKDYKPPKYFIDKVDLHIDLFEKWSNVKAIIKFRKNPNTIEKSRDLKLNGQNIKLKSVLIDNLKLK